MVNIMVHTWKKTYKVMYILRIIAVHTLTYSTTLLVALHLTLKSYWWITNVTAI